MKAMQLSEPAGKFTLVELPRPRPGPGEVLVKVHACGVCRTDLHVIDGDLTDGRYPVVPGHQIVGVVEIASGGEVAVGQRVGIAWLGYTCGACGFCTTGQENLCDSAEFTGYQRPGGFAEYVVADARFCFPLPDGYPDVQAAPLLCAGLIGYRALLMAVEQIAGETRRIGLYGFGNAAHILAQIAVWEGREIYAFTRDGDAAGQAFARSLGAVWAGEASQPSPELLDAAIIFAPDGALVPQALRQLRKGGAVICAGIHMSDIPSFDYAALWGERSIHSVANLTREDGYRLLEIAPRVPVRTQVQVFGLERTRDALEALRAGQISGAAVVSIL
ncbi:MAG: zinc-dependent alcohol dehydrogenase family protein [Gammaproteobacteria bacterium]|nr:zinc-dependent alcohol dehydrogenase family protein [Gammaproteobacteria bacterium]